MIATAIMMVVGCARIASAQTCTTLITNGSASWATGTTGQWIYYANTVRQTCEGTETEGWIDVQFTCSDGTLMNGRCDKRYDASDTRVEARADGCGDVYGHSMHYGKIPGFLDTWIFNGPLDKNLSAPCQEYDPCDIPGADPQTCGGSPIIVAVNKRRDYKLTSAAEGVPFDLDGDGIVEQIAWTQPGDDVAFLAYDVNGDGVINSGKELFGNFTVPGVGNGFAALQALNLKLNGNVRVGSIDADQPLFAKLLLWTDANHNGVSEPSELRPFGDLFASIQPAWRVLDRRDGHGNLYRYEGQVFVRTGPGRNYPKGPDEVQTRAVKVYDVFLQVQR